MRRNLKMILLTGGVIAALWLVPLFLPEESGFKFGLSYRVFFSVFALFVGFLFYLLDAPPMPPFKSGRKALGSVVLVFVTSILLVVLLSALSPQFAFDGTAATGITAQEKGKAVYDDPNIGCFLCHTINNVGGTRGPELTHAATVAGNRRPGTPAEEYLRESIVNPGTYVVPTYDNIMPPYFQRLSPEQLKDLIEYLKTLR